MIVIHISELLENAVYNYEKFYICDVKNMRYIFSLNYYKILKNNINNYFIDSTKFINIPFGCIHRHEHYAFYIVSKETVMMLKLAR